MPLCNRCRDGYIHQAFFPCLCPYFALVLLSFFFSRSVRQGEHVPWKEARVQEEDPREEVLPQPGLQRALCL